MKPDKLFYIGQKALIRKNNEILILHDPVINKIDLPGGKIQIGEYDFNSALKREVYEETCLKIKINRPIDIGYFFFSRGTNHRNAGKEIFIVFYDCQYISGKIKISKEHDSYQWINKANYKKYFKDKNNIYEVISKYFNNKYSCI